MALLAEGQGRGDDLRLLGRPGACRRRRGRRRQRPAGHDRGAAGKRAVKVEERKVGKTRSSGSRSTAASRRGADLIAKLQAKANDDLVLEARLTGVRPDELDINTDEVEQQLKASFLRIRVRDTSMPALSEGAIPSADTIAGAFIRDAEARIAELEADPGDASTVEAAELRDVLRLGRLLLAGYEVSL